MSTTALARSATRRVGRAKATVVALCLGGSLALTGGIAAQAVTQDDVVNGAGTTTVGTSSTTDTDSSSATSSTGSDTSSTDTGVSSASGGSSDATSQGS